MAERAGQRPRPFAAALEQWAATGCAVGPDGTDTGKPVELIEAEAICGLLREFPGYTYSSLMNEDAAFLRHVKIEAMGRRPSPE